MTIKMNKQPFKVGDKVTSSFFTKENDVVRKVLSCEEGNYGSGWGASADGGEMCPCCKRFLGTPIHMIDSHWFKKAPKG